MSIKLKHNVNKNIYNKCLIDGKDYYKIGITKNDVLTRFGRFVYDYLKIKELIIVEGLYYNECYKTEQYVLEKFSKLRVPIETDIFKSTECFEKNIENELMIIIKERKWTK